MNAYRTEHDLLGTREVPEDALHGIYTERAIENFPLSLRPINPALIHAYGAVKLACARTNHELGSWEDAKYRAIEIACIEMMEGRLDGAIRVDALQGGAGTSTNMNVNEVLANRALQLLGKPLGDYQSVSPIEDINLHQSTNDTYPTALKVAAIQSLRLLQHAVIGLLEEFQRKEQAFAHIVKIGRTQLQDAVLITLGREMGAYAEAFARDRWRIYKCEERLRIVNLGGTAIGTGLGAPRQYIFPRSGSAARDHAAGIGARRKSCRVHTECRRIRGSPRHLKGMCNEPVKDCHRCAAAIFRTGRRIWRDPFASASGRFLHHARESESGNSGSGVSSCNRRNGQRSGHRPRLRNGQS
jgi:fumarate hydratase class II